jgi:hypothetical protein
MVFSRGVMLSDGYPGHDPDGWCSCLRSRGVIHWKEPGVAFSNELVDTRYTVSSPVVTLANFLVDPRIVFSIGGPLCYECRVSGYPWGTTDGPLYVNVVVSDNAPRSPDEPGSLAYRSMVLAPFNREISSVVFRVQFWLPGQGTQQADGHAVLNLSGEIDSDSGKDSVLFMDNGFPLDFTRGSQDFRFILELSCNACEEDRPVTSECRLVWLNLVYD